LYITHDLATAYYISDVIAIMYRGCIVEFGEARTILTSPQHPYTQLLLESIPLIGKKWEREPMAMSDIETKEFRFEGCKFYNRCPKAKDLCMNERPAAVRKDDGRDVYCHFA
jgi:peptide/nickel transport system ATP-binding protein